MSIEIRSTEQLAVLARVLKDAGEKDLQREMIKMIVAAVKPVKPAVQASARRTLPKRGGLAARVAKASITTRRRSGPRITGVRVVTPVNPSIDKGTVRHPVFGHRDRWVTQRVHAGYWTTPTKAARSDIQRAMAKGMDGLVAKIGRRI